MIEHLGTLLKKWCLRNVDLSGPFNVGTKTRGMDATLIVSQHPEKEGAPHRPVLDLDFPCYLFYSTHGNAHLLIDKEMTAEQYDKLLAVMVEVGLYNQGCYNYWKKAGFTGVRLPWITKTGPNS